MKRRSLSGALIALVLSLLTTLSLAASAAAEEPPLAFRLQASNGFEFVVEAGPPPEGNEGWIGLILQRDRTSGVTYAAPATVTRSRIDADLGELGRISVKRKGTGRMKTVRRCQRGPRVRVEAQRFEGTIEFHGEEGFAEVSATAAPMVELPACGVIPEGGRPPGKSLPGARLSANLDTPESDDVKFYAVQNRPGARTSVSAEVEEHRGEMEIHRAIGVWADAGALTYDRQLRTATVMPPGPFDGQASFDSGASRLNRWTGNLTVDLPGHADVPVAGPGFTAVLRHPTR